MDMRLLYCPVRAPIGTRSQGALTIRADAHRCSCRWCYLNRRIQPLTVSENAEASRGVRGFLVHPRLSGERLPIQLEQLGHGITVRDIHAPE